MNVLTKNQHVHSPNLNFYWMSMLESTFSFSEPRQRSNAHQQRIDNTRGLTRDSHRRFQIHLAPRRFRQRKIIKKTPSIFTTAVLANHNVLRFLGGLVLPRWPCASWVVLRFLGGPALPGRCCASWVVLRFLGGLAPTTRTSNSRQTGLV